MTPVKIRHGSTTIWHDDTLPGPFDPRLFQPEWLRQAGLLRGSSTGRNAAFFLHHAGQDMVLRHFWRGGLVGRVNPDLYLRRPVAQSRAMQEFLLLDWMRGQGLPVPRPVAARYSPAGPFYRADLITLRLPGTRTLAERLKHGALPRADWAAMGRVIGDMHRLGVDHTDLNCRNILIDDQDRIWLIDFDKCARRAPGPWAQANLDRLHRSLTKEKTKVADLAWAEADWQALLQGHAEAGTAAAGRQ